ncbi:MAG TPA: glycerophosphodiester phosphodiesterase family protein [Candidatus Binataceae bacterium]|nr:glycerophosphodiester phosphodiesterase family protein [Candidatus Binataceae bacterium]
MLTIAHRGASAIYPENTLRAFIAAADLGADMCEFDVRMTRDGEVVVIHDATVNRTTNGRGRVAAMTAEALKRLDAGVRFGAEFHGEPIPTLAEVAAALGTRGGKRCGRRCGMDVELKQRGLETRVCDILRERGAIEDAMVSSFDWDQLEIVAAQERGLRLALLGEKAPAALLEAAAAMHAFAIAPRFDIADAALCAEAHRLGLAVYVWTVDDAPTMRRMMAAGVDGIMTNDLKRLREVAAN